MSTRYVMSAPHLPLVPVTFDAVAGVDEVVVAVAGCGVCHTDLGFHSGAVRTTHPLPLCLGHEIAGRVVAAGRGVDVAVGTAVIVPAVIPCGVCDHCLRGKATICARQTMPGNDIHGGFATHVVVPARGLCHVDEVRAAAAGLSLADLSVVADAVTTPYQALAQAHVGPGDLVVVVGVGGVGGYAVQIARALGAEVVAIDVDRRKLDGALGQGAALALDAREHDQRALKAAISAFAKAHDMRQTEWIVLECSGTRAGQETAFGLLVRGATLCVVGFTMERVDLRLSNLMALHARALGNWGCPPALYPAALELVLDGRVSLRPFVEHHPLSEIDRVFSAAHHGELTRRAVLVPEGAPR